MMAKVTCPHCKGEAEIKYGVSNYFCPYCGKRIQLIAQSNENDVRTNVNFNVDIKNTTERKIDDARIKEADVKESIELRKLELKQAQSKNSIIMMAVAFGSVALIVFITLAFAF